MSSCEPDERLTSCPTPREDRAFLLDSGEVVPIRCGRNGCPYCRRLNVQVTAAVMGINATEQEQPPSYAVLTTTRDWIPDEQLRECWAQFARRVRREVAPDAGYAWFREWTEGRSDGIRRTHYHSVWSGIEGDDQAAAVAEISRSIMARSAGAWSPEAHGYQRVWDSGGLTRYVAGLVGHHLKQNQQPPPGWKGRRYGVSRGWYAIPRDELLKRAKAAVRDDRLRHRLELAVIDSTPDVLPDWIVDEVVTARLEELREQPPPRVIRLN